MEPWLVVLSLVAACATGGANADASMQRDGRVADSRVADSPRDGTSSGGCTYSGVLATWSFTGQPGSQASTPPTSSATGVTAGAISRAAAVTAVSGANSINASNWATTAQPDLTKYYTLSLAPPAGCAMSATSMSIDVSASATGPTSAAVATSIDAFAQTAAVSTSAPSTPSLSVSNATASVELRIYGYGASGSSGTMRVQTTLTVTGSLQ